MTVTELALALFVNTSTYTKVFAVWTGKANLCSDVASA